MTITPLPPAPNRTDPATFSDKADNFVAALPGFVSEANSQAVVVNQDAANAGTSASNAATSATASADSATASQSSATASADSATASQDSATASANSATASANSATASAASATAADTSADEAAASADSINPDSIAITGGTIDGTVIGGTTPAAISGTTGAFSGNLTVDTNTLFVDAASNRVGVGTSSPTETLGVDGTIGGTVVASQAEAEAGISNTRVMTPLRVSQAISEKRFTSSPQTITSGGLVTVAHGLGVTPSIVLFRLKCLTAEIGFSVGDEIILGENSSSGTNPRYNAIIVNNTNIAVRLSNNAGSSFATGNKGTGAAAAVSNTNWELYIEAWV